MRCSRAALFLALVVARPLCGQDEKAPPPARTLGLEERRRELTELRRRLGDLKTRYAAVQKREADLKEALAAAELNLQIRTAERRMLELSYAEVEKAATGAKDERDRSATEVTALQTDLSVRLGALYRMGRLGYLRTLVVAESGRTFLRGLQVLTHLAKRDAAMLAHYRESLATLKVRERDLAVKQGELYSLAAESRAKEAEMTAARAEKARLLAQVSRTVEEDRVQVARLTDKSERLASLLDLLETHGRALAPGAASIRKYRGVLDWPLKGKVVVPFGRIANPKFPKTFLRSSGWTLDAQPGTDVRAIFAGEVVFAQWLKGYGNLVVVDHGDGVFTLYGRLATGSSAQRAQRVGVGDVVGQLGPAPDEEVPGLYFELRDNRTSMDPRIWLK